jgi:hypothetical protein
MDPARAIRAKLWATRGLAGVAALGLAVWAFMPLASPTIEAPDLRPEQASPSQDEPDEPWNESAFAAVIWHAPPKPEVVEPAPTAQRMVRRTPMNIQLIAIVTRDDGTSLAALYDPDTDALHLVASGEPIGDFTVEAIEPPLVTLAQGPERHTIRLDKEGG